MLEIQGEPIYLRSDCHPEANGRKPEYGDTQWTLDLALEDGRRLFLNVGQKGHDHWTDLVGFEKSDDIATIHRLEAELAKEREWAFDKRNKLLVAGICANGCGLMVDDGDSDSHCPACHFQYSQRSFNYS